MLVFEDGETFPVLATVLPFPVVGRCSNYLETPCSRRASNV